MGMSWSAGCPWSLGELRERERKGGMRSYLTPLLQLFESRRDIFDVHALADLGPVYEPGLEWGAEVSKIVSVSRASSTR